MEKVTKPQTEQIWMDFSIVPKGINAAVMAQDTHVYGNGSVRKQRPKCFSPSYKVHRQNSISAGDTVPCCLETSYGYQLDLDFLKYVDDIQKCSTMKRLSFRRRLREASSVGEPQSGTTPNQWNSSESLSSASSDDTRFSTVSRGRPPLPPPHGTSSNATTPSSSEGAPVSQKPSDGKPPTGARSLAAPRYNPLVERTLVETRRRLEQEKSPLTQPEPHPRRRLATFGGVGSIGSLSPFTGWGAYNQDTNGNKPSGAELSLQPSTLLGSGGSLRPSPQSSGRATPVTGLSPQHLQHVRDQMVVALQRLKELEEQVKTIPVLQVKISVLQEEKRQMVSLMKNPNKNQETSDVFRKRAQSAGSSDRIPRPPGVGKASELREVKAEEELEAREHSVTSGLREFRQLTAEMEALERTIKGGRLQARHGLDRPALYRRAQVSATVGIDEDKDRAPATSSKQYKNAAVETRPIETRCVATGVSEAHLGIVTDGEAELEAQQQIIEALKERICQLETELKESTLQTEMGRLRLELHAAGARNRSDKSSTARPSTSSTATETQTQSRSVGVGNHTHLKDACTGGRWEVAVCSVGSSCSPQFRSVSSGPEVLMSQWEVREHVERRDQCVGRRVLMHSRSVGAEVKTCELGINTDVTLGDLASGDGWAVGETVKEVVSHGVATEPIRGVDLGIMVSPQTASQLTNTAHSSVSRFTNTRRLFNTNSSTNTVLDTQEKHTNTAHAVTRTVAVGNSRVHDLQVVAKTRSVAVGSSSWAGDDPTRTAVALAKAATRDMGVGMASVDENFLVGLETRNMACGPSLLPDPTKTRSVGVGEGRIRDYSSQLQPPPQSTQLSPQEQPEPGLDHYIEKMQHLLMEQQGLLTESYSELGEVFTPPHSSLQPGTVFTQPHSSRLGPISSQLASTVSSMDTAMRLGLTSPPSTDNEQSSNNTPLDDITPGLEVRRQTPTECQLSTDVRVQPANAFNLRSIMKKQDGDAGSITTRKSLKFMGVRTGWDPLCQPPSSEDASSEDEERNGKKCRASSGILDGQGSEAACPGQGAVGGGCRSHLRVQIHGRFKLSEKVLSACQSLKSHLNDEESFTSRELRSCLNTLQHEWFRVSSQKSAVPAAVKDHLSAFRAVSPSVLRHVANMADGNGNTALHYSVSHSNFRVVKMLLDAEVCNVNQQNKAGYTPIMLAALAAVEAPDDMRVVEELFTQGDVNARASQAGQTALMLAVSHGRMDMVQALLAQGAEVNLQDDEGSTALMCASEHGHAEMVRLVLAQPGCDATLRDGDESTALSIALEAGHRDIAVLLYAHVNFSKGPVGGTPRACNRSLSSFSGRSYME
ncbi:KN motif and ankyrin repeat domain-containing protein 1b isoform X2 [Hypomesus transpacificus]|uniref:KN motif and ankyrin repeat domain-containing protein 1b isoform X2 n=1 Tax=Hypomesus transpacificus TaxID=137520 RepID=UPI001F079EAE|nr:KN motif and ankyrin repeat domain-containing protein 1b isoform X2 [Hypomesus transpacificus]